MFGRWMMVVAAALVLLVAGCGKAPQEEMQQAQSALSTDSIKDLDQYAPEAFQAARDTLNAAMAAKQEQDSHFALTRNYKSSKQMFISAKNLADAASQKAEAEKDRVRGEAEQAINTAKGVIDSTNALFAKAPKGKDTKADLMLIKGEIDALGPALDQAQSDLTAGQYLTAKSKAEAVIDKAHSVSGEISTALARKTKR